VFRNDSNTLNCEPVPTLVTCMFVKCKLSGYTLSDRVFQNIR